MIVLVKDCAGGKDRPHDFEETLPLGEALMADDRRHGGEFYERKPSSNVVTPTRNLKRAIAVLLLCVGVVMVDPKARIAGMIHVALPDSNINSAKAKQHPGYFADTGIPLLIREMQKLGSTGKGRGLIVKIAGGANILDPNNTFSIGYYYNVSTLFNCSNKFFYFCFCFFLFTYIFEHS